MAHCIVPLIGTEVTAFLGVAYLPRLWLTTLLARAGALPAGYRSGNDALDADFMRHFEVDRAAFRAFIDGRPSYLDCEDWMRRRAGNLEFTGIIAWNRIVSRRLRPEHALEDWDRVHAHAARSAGVPIVPALSSDSVGPLGAKHLPRLWLKAYLKALGSLPEGWRSGPLGGMDEITYANLSLDARATIAYVESTRPVYLNFEAWVREHGTVDRETIARHNGDVIRDKPEERAATERADLGLNDPTVRNNRLINDLVDWQALRDDVASRGGVARA